MKRLIKIIAAAAVILSLTTAVSAREITDKFELLYNGGWVSVFFDAEREEKFTESEAELYSMIENANKLRIENIDISKAGYTDIDALHCFLEQTFNIEVYWNEISGDVVYTVDDETGIVTEVTVTYDPAEEKKYLASGSETSDGSITTIEQGIAHAKTAVEEGMTDLQIVLALHDYIVRECDYYPGDISDLNKVPENNFKLEGVLIDRIAVCQGYAITYSRLLMEYGISSCIVVSDPMVHAWNMVQLDGNWYHVDATWDDPLNMRGGYVSHEYFLKSDSEFLALEHHSWYVQNAFHPGDDSYSSTPTADVSNSYAGYVFRDIADTNPSDEVIGNFSGMLNYYDGKYYSLRYSYTSEFFYSNTDLLCISDIAGTDMQIIALDKYYYYLFLYGDKLYVNTQNQVVELNLDGSVNRVVTIPQDGTITNLWVKLDKLCYSLKVDETVTEHEVNTEKENVIEIDNMEFFLYDDGTAALTGYSGEGTENKVIIPEYVSGHKVTEIGSAAFSFNETIGEVILPDSVEKIGAEAFRGSSIRSVFLPVGLKYIDSAAFFNCNNLVSVELPHTLEAIGGNAFEYCQFMEKVTFLGEKPAVFGYKVFTDPADSDFFDADFTIYYPLNNETWEVTGSGNGKFTWTAPEGRVYNAVGFEKPTVGDYDDDGETTNKDLSALIDYFTGSSSTAPEKSWADVNNDKTVNRKDAMIMARYLAGWSEYNKYFE